MEMEILVRKKGCGGGVCRPRQAEVSSACPVPCGQAKVQPQLIIQRRVRDGCRERGTLLFHLDFPPSDIMSLKRMLEKLGVPKTHLELKKLIREVSSGSEETFSYSDFLTMMLGKRSAILRV